MWHWGDAHFAHSEHRPFSRIELLAPWFDILVPTAGDSFTVNVGRYSLKDEREPFANRHAASFRAIYDLANPDNSAFVHSSGQSGNVFSPRYRSFSSRWAKVQYIRMVMERKIIEDKKMGTLKLKPGRPH
jgi:penicillin amidase